MEGSHMKKLFIVLLAVAGCQEKPRQIAVGEHPHKQAISCESNIPARFASHSHASHGGMIWIEGGSFQMGADNGQASEDEYPKHQVTVGGFWMDKTEVTNAQVAAFVQATGYITTAEKTPDGDQLKKQLPPGTAKPGAIFGKVIFRTRIPPATIFMAPRRWGLFNPMVMDYLTWPAMYGNGAPTTIITGITAVSTGLAEFAIPRDPIRLLTLMNHMQ